MPAREKIREISWRSAEAAGVKVHVRADKPTAGGVTGLFLREIFADGLALPPDRRQHEQARHEQGARDAIDPST